MLFRAVYIFIILFIAGQVCHAQNALYRHYTVKDGLPSNKIYGIIEDREGRIWIGTDRGIARFNGRRFTVFTTANGLPTNDVTYFYFDTLGRTWILDYTPYLTYIKNDTVHSVQVMPKDVSFNKMNYSYYNGMAFTRKHDGKVVAGTNTVASVIDLVKYMEFLNPNYDSKKNEGHTVYNYDGRNLVIHDYQSIKHYDLLKGAVKTFPYKQGTDSFPFNTYRFGPRFFKEKYLLSIQNNNKDSFTFLNFKTGAYKHVGIKMLTNNNTNVTGFDVFEDHVQITTNNGFEIIDSNLQIRDQFLLPENLTDISCNSIYRDHNKGYWLSTHNDGVYFISRELNSYKQLVPNDALQGSTVVKLYLSDGNYYIFNKRNELIITDSNFRLLRKHYLPAFSTFQTDERKAYLFKDGHRGHYIIASRGIYYLTLNNELIALKDRVGPSIYPEFLEYGMNSVKGCVYDERTKCIIFINHLVFTRLWFDGHYFNYEDIMHRRFTNISKGTDKEFWLSDDIGNLTILDSAFKIKKDYNIGSAITYQISDPYGHIIAALDGQGIYCYKKGTSRFQRLYAGSDMQAMKADSSGLWMATNNAINYYHYHNGAYKLQAIYPNIDGRVYEEVYSIDITSDKIILICDKGIIQLQRQRANIALIDAAWAKTVRVYTLKTGLNKRHYLPVGTNSYSTEYINDNINFLYTSNSTPYVGDVYYQYYLEGNDREWQSTLEEEISYPSLKPGTYTLHLKAVVKNTNINSGEYLFKIQVLPAWWQTWWFTALILLIISGAVTVGVYYIIRRSKLLAIRKANIDKRMAGLELTALQAQMNPHFIFNALSSIQSFIHSQDSKLADDLLQKFSLLIRLYLEFSQHQFIALKHELKSLELYTSIERIRFSNRFDVSIRVRNVKEKQVTIPPMLVQPLVENAINHGLYHKKDKGLLKVIFWVQEECTIVIVDDDGIGREAAKKLRRKLFPSRGNKLIKDRIEVLKLSGIADTSMEIIDKKDKFGNSNGTRVILTLQKAANSL